MPSVDGFFAHVDDVALALVPGDCASEPARDTHKNTMSEPRIIKRYANRKLYDTQHSRYVTLEQIAEMIRQGDDVQIIDNKSKDDLTSVTLAQIIFEEEKKQKSFLPLQAMRNIIQTGGESISHLVSSAQKKVTGILPAKQEGESDGTDLSENRSNISTWREFRDWLENSQRTVEAWQHKVDERIRDVVGGISSPFAPLAVEIRSLSSRIAELEGKLRGLVQSETKSDENHGSDEDSSDKTVDTDEGSSLS